MLKSQQKLWYLVWKVCISGRIVISWVFIFFTNLRWYEVKVCILSSCLLECVVGATCCWVASWKFVYMLYNFVFYQIEPNQPKYFSRFQFESLFHFSDRSVIRKFGFVRSNRTGWILSPTISTYSPNTNYFL